MQETTKRKICVVIASRANYGSIRSALTAMQRHPAIELQIVASASALLDKYGDVASLIEKEGFPITERLYTLVEGETLGTMAKSTGLALLELPTVFERLRPDVVLTVGDRFETTATAVAAAYLNIPLAHTMGGEVSGTIDERVRHAITKLADIHFPACSDAAERIIKMGEDPALVHMVGCPRIDATAALLNSHNGGALSYDLNSQGVGAAIDITKPFLIVAQYPVTTEYHEGERQVNETLVAVAESGVQAIWLWPNADAGAEDVSRGIRKFREREEAPAIRFFKHIPLDDYLKLMVRAACVVGNSSSAIREGEYIGTPAVNIGTRQLGRQRGKNVVDAGYDRAEILAAIQKQTAHGKYPSERIYGDGKAGEKIADVLATCDLSTVKRMMY